jgi:hypothetical protein
MLVLGAACSAASAADEGDPESAVERCHEALSSLLQIVRKADAPVDVVAADRACTDAMVLGAAGERTGPPPQRLADLVEPLAQFSYVAATLEELGIAERAIAAAVVLGERNALRPGVQAENVASLARIRGRRGDPGAEEEGLLRALALAERESDPIFAATVCEEAARMYEQRREYARAESLYIRQVELYEQRIELSRVPEDSPQATDPLWQRAMSALESDRAEADESRRRVRRCRRADERDERMPLECCIRTEDCGAR